MVLNEYGEIVKNEIIKLPEYHKRIVLNECVIIPKIMDKYQMQTSKHINILRNTIAIEYNILAAK